MMDGFLSICENDLIRAQSNKSLDASGGSVFLNLIGAAKGALIRAAASIQTLDACAMNLFRRHPIVSGIALGIIIACAGSYLGQAFAIHHTNEIAQQVRAQHPDDPLDGLWIIGLGITLIGSLVATVIGIIAGLILYVELKRSAALNLRSPVRSEARKLYQ